MTAFRADLLSDTLTTPSAGMRAAMADAPVGDDVFGEDPTVRALEEEVAGLLGHEAGLFTPTGSMANQLGLRLHVAPGQELLSDHGAHVVRAELGAAAVLSGITSRTWFSENGRLDPDAPLRMATVGVGPYQVETRLVVVENTHNFGGGTIQRLEDLRRLRAACAGLGIALHLDGARLWNAHIATGVPLADYGREFDTVSVCLSKGLGAPVGSVLLGSADQMAESRVWRKRFGGGMRQVGILAAAGRYALAHHLDRLAEDHRRARRFAEDVAQFGDGLVDPAAVETNIVMVDVARLGLTPAAVSASLAEHSVRAYAVDARRLRFVWHLGVDDAATGLAVDAMREVLRG